MYNFDSVFITFVLQSHLQVETSVDVSEIIEYPWSHLPLLRLEIGEFNLSSMAIVEQGTGLEMGSASSQVME